MIYIDETLAGAGVAARWQVEPVFDCFDFEDWRSMSIIFNVHWRSVNRLDEQEI